MRICDCGHAHEDHHEGERYGLETFHCTECGCPEYSEARAPEAGRSRGLLEIIEKNRLCVVPPNQETTDWSVYANFDGEFGYDNEIGTGATLAEALEMAAAVIEDTEDVR